MPTEVKPCADQKLKSGMPEAYYHLHALLTTLRALASHEDEVCTLLTQIQRTQKVSTAVRRELGQMLERLPLLRLEHELEALRAEIDQA